LREIGPFATRSANVSPSTSSKTKAGAPSYSSNP
jgi:hypothetical protein